MGAMAPSCAAMSAGSLKIPAPIVVLTMPAARASVPIERRREDSEDDGLFKRAAPTLQHNPYREAPDGCLS